MKGFTIITERHPAVFVYYNELKGSFRRSTYFKGTLSFKRVKDQYRAYIEMEKYIPAVFIYIGFSTFIAALIFYLTNIIPFYSWVVAIPGVIILFVYWLFQTRIFYYLVIYLALRKAGYKGEVILRLGQQ